MKSRRQFLRDFEAAKYLDFFLIMAVTTVLVIRLYLHVLGYPSISPGRLHVAHVLWGGFLMMAAIIVLLSFLGRGAHHLAALLGGIGFGTFIDEIGKFLTTDNDYFFRPTAALIYVIFVLVYLAIRSIHKERVATHEEFLVNALQEIEQVAVADLDEEERDRALRYLMKSDPDDPLVQTLRSLLLRSDLAPTPKPGLLSRLRDRAVTFYRRAASWPWFTLAVNVFFIAQLLIKIGFVVALVFFAWKAGGSILRIPVFSPLRWSGDESSVTQWGQLASSLLSGVFVALGVFHVRRDRARGYRLFQRSILVSIFLTQVFHFYVEEFTAVAGLAFNILVYLALQFMIEREQEGMRS